MSNPIFSNEPKPIWRLGRQSDNKSLMFKFNVHNMSEYPNAFFKTPKQNLDCAYEKGYSLVDAYECLEEDLDYECNILNELPLDHRVSLESKKIQTLGYVGQACLLMKPTEEKILMLHHSEKCKLLAKALMKIAEVYEYQEEDRLYSDCYNEFGPKWREEAGYKKDEELDAMIGTIEELEDQICKERINEFYDDDNVDTKEQEKDFNKVWLR